MPLLWENNVPPQPSPGSFPDTVNEASAVETSVLQASILELLEEHRHEVETLLERHRLALRRAVERVSIFGKAAVPVAEALGPAGASQAEASAADGAAGASSAAGPSSGEVSCALPSSANAAAPVAEALHRAAPKVDASKVKPAAGRTSADTAGEDPSVSAEVTETVTKPPQDAPPPADSRSAKATELVAPAQDAPPLAVIATASADASVTPRTMASTDTPDTPSSSAHTPGQKKVGTFIKRLATNETQEFPEGSVRARLFLQMKGPRFEALAGVLILANTVTTFMQLHFDGQKARAVLHDGAADEAHHTKAAFDALSTAFAVIFLAELTLKLYVHRRAYFHEKFNTIDAVIVVMSSIDALIDASDLNLAFLRTTKVLRLARAFRVIRTMNIFTELRVLMKTIVLSFRSMIWSMMILFIFMLVGALLLCQLQQETIKDDAVDMAVREKAFDYYGTPEWALYTIFEATFSGCWPNYASSGESSMIRHDPLYILFWVPYVLFVVFTLIRIIYALLLKDTMQAAANDADDVVREKTKQTAKLMKQLREVFEKFERSGDNHLSREEFRSILAHKNVRTWMHSLGVDTHDEENLFEILDDGDGMLSIDEFVNGILRTKGQAHQQQMLCNMRDTHRILVILRALQTDIREVLHPGEHPSSCRENGP